MYNLFAENFVVVGKYIYFVAYEMNLLCRFSLQEEKVEILDAIPDQSIKCERLVGDVVYWNNQLIFTPLRAEKIWVYHLDEDKWEGIELPEEIGKTEYTSKGAILCGNILFMPGFGYQGMIIMELDTRKVFGIEFQDERCDKKLDGCFWGNSYVKKQNSIYLASLQSNIVVKFDMDSYEYECFAVGEAENRYISIGWDGDKYWLVPRFNGPYVIWDGESAAQNYTLPSAFLERDCYFSGIELMHGKKIMFYGFQDKTLWVDGEKVDTCFVENESCYLAKKVKGLGHVRFLKGKIQIIYEDGTKKDFMCVIDTHKRDSYIDSKKIIEKYFKEAGEHETQMLDLNYFLEKLIND